jgi:predicted transcriptional regulator
MWWSRGPRRDRKDVWFDRFDCRPHFMKFEFNCRTSDNVELVLEGILFWELVDLPAMWRHTGDTSGDIVYHLRSKFILQVAQVSLKTFMETLHLISKSILDSDAEFYAARGLKVHSLEVTRYQCADKSTAEILEQIIQETTNRMNRLSQAESENEVNLFRAQGQVEQAKLNAEILKLQREEQEADAQVSGRAEAERVASFLSGLEKSVPLLEDRIKMWQVLRKTDALSVISNGGANLYYTPSDVDLSIETRSANASSPGTC